MDGPLGRHPASGLSYQMEQARQRAAPKPPSAPPKLDTGNGGQDETQQGGKREIKIRLGGGGAREASIFRTPRRWLCKHDPKGRAKQHCQGRVQEGSDQTEAERRGPAAQVLGTWVTLGM